MVVRFTGISWSIPVANPLLVLTISGGVFVLDFMITSVSGSERTRVRKTLERYVSKNIVKELLDNPATLFSHARSYACANR